MNNQEFDAKLRAYMQSGGEKAFPLDERRVYAGGKPRRRFQTTKKAPALLAAALILVVSAFAIPPVRAALGSLFTFIPGVGIVEKGNDTIYAVVPMAGSIEADGLRVDLDNAVYAKKHLNVSMMVNGRIPYDDFTLYINGEPIDRQEISYSMAGSSRRWECRLYLKMNPPESGDTFEIAIEGFSQRLSFVLEPCRDYEDLAAIGPTVTQNGISITVTAERVGSELRVRYYPSVTSIADRTGLGIRPVESDTLQEYGTPYQGFGPPYSAELIEALPELEFDEYFKAFNEKFVPTHIVTESGFTSRQVNAHVGQSWYSFAMPESDGEATLHIPCLTMRRYDERSKRFSVDIPKDYAAVDCDISLEYSLGTVRITKVERRPPERVSLYGSVIVSEYDDLIISVAFESKDDNMIFSSFSFEHTKNRGSGASIDEETGCMNEIVLPVKPNEKRATVITHDLEYFLLGEYVIPLDIP